MKPNVLFLVIDSLSEDRFFGDSRSCKTPNIDSLPGKMVYILTIQLVHLMLLEFV